MSSLNLPPSLSLLDLALVDVSALKREKEEFFELNKGIDSPTKMSSGLKGFVAIN
jgi:hypothetical protein